MTRREERKLLREVHENNIMLRQFIAIARYYITNAQQENEDDFGRNVLANLLSNIVELKGLKR